MMQITSYTLPLLAAALAAAALSVAGCGGPDQADIRAVVKEFERLGDDATRKCELLTPRAKAQAAALTGESACAKALRGFKRSEDPPSPAAIDKAPLQVDGDRAVLTLDGLPTGLRNVGGEWQIDNLVNGTLEDRRTIPRPLARGSDEQQVRATLKAWLAAYAKQDFERACDLFGTGAEAQFVVAWTLGSSGNDRSCVGVHRQIARSGDGEVSVDDAPEAAAVDAAKVSIRGARATVKVAGHRPRHFVREDGHWLVGPDPEAFGESEPTPSAAELERCWRRAGARIASTRADLRFASFDTVTSVSDKPGLVSVKGDDWRIFYTVPEDGEDPGIDAILADPSRASAVAYVKDASDHPRVVARARSCGT
jgi:hypothetical protein